MENKFACLIFVGSFSRRDEEGKKKTHKKNFPETWERMVKCWELRERVVKNKRLKEAGSKQCCFLNGLKNNFSS